MMFGPAQMLAALHFDTSEEYDIYLEFAKEFGITLYFYPAEQTFAFNAGSAGTIDLRGNYREWYGAMFASLKEKFNELVNT